MSKRNMRSILSAILLGVTGAARAGEEGVAAPPPAAVPAADSVAARLKAVDSPPIEISPPPFAQTPRPLLPQPPTIFTAAGDNSVLRIGGLVRAFYANDQRILWSGLEQTEGAEGVFSTSLESNFDEWTVRANGTFFVNLPNSQNILHDAARDAFVHNFQHDVVDVFELNVQLQYHDFTFTLGKAPTPFGRYYFPLYTNSLQDAPFLRSEIIPFTETGAFVRYAPGLLVFDAGLINGADSLANNSDRGFVGRAGIQTENFACGASAKVSDYGSEVQKMFQNAFGVDAMVRSGAFTLSAEAIYDQHGFHHNPFQFRPVPDYGPRSFYGRDVFYAVEQPVGAVTYYIDLNYKWRQWQTDVNFGEYFPQQISRPMHDAPNHRGLAKLAYEPFPRVQIFGEGLVENNRPVDWVRRNSQPFALWLGLQYGF